MKHTTCGQHTSAVVLVVALLALGGCGLLPKGNVSLDVSARDRGVASWYGEDFHGKLAADGRPFNMHALTGAHRSLPLGTVVRVVNAHNGRAVHIRITDRGPYVPGRVLDLSRAAAEQLGMTKQGLSPVLIDVVGEAGLGGQIAAARVELDRDLSHRIEPGPATTGGLRGPAGQAVLTRQPGDLVVPRRLRRVADVFAANEHVDRTVAMLLIS